MLGEKSCSYNQSLIQMIILNWDFRILLLYPAFTVWCEHCFLACLSAPLSRSHLLPDPVEQRQQREPEQDAAHSPAVRQQGAQVVDQELLRHKDVRVGHVEGERVRPIGLTFRLWQEHLRVDRHLEGASRARRGAAGLVLYLSSQKQNQLH